VIESAGNFLGIHIPAAVLHGSLVGFVMMETLFSAESKAKLFVGQIPLEILEDELQTYFSPFGALKEVSIIRDPLSGLSRGCAFVTFVDKSAADAAVEALHNVVHLPSSPNPLQVRFAETPLDRENKVFVGMLPKTFTEHDLSSMFSVFGDLKEIHIIRSQDGSPKGCAFVKYFNKDAAAAAIAALNETIPQGASRPIVVKFADTKKTRSEAYSDANVVKDFSSRFSHQMFERRLGYGSNMVSDRFERNQVLLVPSAHHGYFMYGAGTDSVIDGRVLTSQTIRPPEGPDGANLFVYHLPRDITDADLATLFAPFGNVISAKVFVDKKTSDSKGFGFVSYDSFESANLAIDSMNGFQIGSKRLKVQHKRIGSSENLPHFQTYNARYPSPEYAGNDLERDHF
jgi:CUG-BP- and ETR3-like factor